MIDQRPSRQPRAVRELEVVHLREDDLDGEAVDLRAEQAVSRVDGLQALLSTKPSTTGCGSMRTKPPPFR